MLYFDEEGLDSAVINKSVKAISEADTLIIGGTSLIVYPAAGFIDYFSGKHLVVINKGCNSQRSWCGVDDCGTDRG